MRLFGGRGFHAPKLPWLYIIFFCFLLALFTGFLYSRAKLLAKIGEYERLAAKNGIILQGMDFSLLPPGLKISRASVILKQGGLNISNIEIAPLYSPPALKIKGFMLDGSLDVRLALASFTKPAVSGMAFEAMNLNLKNASELSGEYLRGIRVTAGAANVMGQLVKSRGNLDGTIDIVLSGGELKTDLPFLRKKSFQEITGQVNLNVAGRRLGIRECVLRSGNDVFSMQGGIEGWQKPAMARLDIDLSLRIDPASLEQELIPKKMLAKIRKDGVISAHIGQTLAHPRFKAATE